MLHWSDVGTHHASLPAVLVHEALGEVEEARGWRPKQQRTQWQSTLNVQLPVPSAADRVIAFGAAAGLGVVPLTGKEPRKLLQEPRREPGYSRATSRTGSRGSYARCHNSFARNRDNRAIAEVAIPSHGCCSRTHGNCSEVHHHPATGTTPAALFFRAVTTFPLAATIHVNSTAAIPEAAATVTVLFEGPSQRGCASMTIVIQAAIIHPNQAAAVHHGFWCSHVYPFSMPRLLIHSLKELAKKF